MNDRNAVDLRGLLRDRTDGPGQGTPKESNALPPLHATPQIYAVAARLSDVVRSAEAIVASRPDRFGEVSFGLHSDENRSLNQGAAVGLLFPR